jgi:hypothetical protein
MGAAGWTWMPSLIVIGGGVNLAASATPTTSCRYSSVATTLPSAWPNSVT